MNLTTASEELVARQKLTTALELADEQLLWHVTLHDDEERFRFLWKTREHMHFFAWEEHLVGSEMPL